MLRRATMCPAAPDHVSGPDISAWEGSSATTCTMASEPATLLGRAPAPSHVLRLWILPPYQEESSAAMHPMVPCGLRASSIKKSLAGQPVQLGSHVSIAHTHVSMAPHTRAIMGLQDVREESTYNACKTCGHAATV
jgi:hypothetical protein